MERLILLVLLLFIVACSPGSERAPGDAGGSLNPGRQSSERYSPEQDINSELEDKSQPSPELPNLGPAPELTNEVWLNTDQPLRLADLRGKVILLEMWTFGWINCQNVIPSLRDWHDRLGPQGLTVIANHYPEFDYEADLARLEESVIQSKITYPVAQDNDGETWRAYKNRYWPTLYLIDKRGDIRFQHIGEGNEQRIEAAILSLLAEPYP